MATSAFTKNLTAAEVVNNVLIALGLDTATNVFESEDTNIVQLRSLLTRAGKKLMDKGGAGGWQFLQREMTITTSIGVTEYALPTDFESFIQDASWNRTTRLPAIGSLSEQEWQMLKARQLQGTTFTMLFKVSRDRVVLYDTPSVVQTLVLPYVGRGWVLREDDTYADNVQNDDDLILYDGILAEAALRLEWDIEKKFDTSGSTLQLNDALSTARAGDKPGRTRTLNRTASFPYLGKINIPDTGYGSS